MPQPKKLNTERVFAACFALKAAGETINPYRVWLACGKVGSTSTAKKPVEAFLACDRGKEPSDTGYLKLYNQMLVGGDTSSDGVEAESFASEKDDLPAAFLGIIEGLAAQVWEYASERIEREVAAANDQGAEVVEEALHKQEEAAEEIKRLTKQLAQVMAQKEALQSQYTPLVSEHEKLQSRCEELVHQLSLSREHLVELEAEVKVLAEARGKELARISEFERVEAAFQVRCVELEQKNISLSERVEVLRGEKEELRSVQSRAEAELEQVKIQRDDERIRQGKLFEEIRLLNAQLVEKEHRAATAEEKVRQLAGQVSQLQQEVATLRGKGERVDTSRKKTSQEKSK